MYNKESRPMTQILLVGMGGFFLLADQLLKWAARSWPDFQYHIFGRWLGWKYMANHGIAFSLPFPNWLLVLITPLIIFGLVVWYFKSSGRNKSFIIYHLSFIFIISGAISNFIDRILFSATIDYLRVFTGVINLADVMIVIGGFLLFVIPQLRRADKK